MSIDIDCLELKFYTNKNLHANTSFSPIFIEHSNDRAAGTHKQNKNGIHTISIDTNLL